MTSSEHIRLEEEIQHLLKHRIQGGHDLEIRVEAYHALNMDTICRIEIFDNTDTENRLAKFEGKVMEGFYFKAEGSLCQQLNIKRQVQNTSETKASGTV